MLDPHEKRELYITAFQLFKMCDFMIHQFEEFDEVMQPKKEFGNIYGGMRVLFDEIERDLNDLTFKLICLVDKLDFPNKPGLRLGEDVEEDNE